MDELTRHALDAVRGGARPSTLESSRLDFKQEARSAVETERMLAEAAICFANGDGGVIVLGVADAVAGPDALVGTDLPAETAQRRIYELTEPSILVAVEELDLDGTRLLVIGVPRGFEIHADRSGRARRRVGSACLPMTPQDQALLREERQGIDWSARPSGSSHSDVDPEALLAARRRLAQAPDTLAELAALSEADLLRGLGVVTEDGTLLRAGEVLFVGPPEGDTAVVYQYRPTPGGEAALVERLSGPLLSAFGRVMDLVSARRHVTPLTLPDGGQVEVADFPAVAVREAVANALLHRDYRLPGPVTVDHSPGSFVVDSPGPLVSGVDATNILTHPSKPRNRCLFAAARKLRIAEETGRGVDRMYRELLRSGHASPEITSEPQRTRVVFVGGAPRTQVVRLLATLAPAWRDDVDTLLVLSTMLTQRGITSGQLAPVIQKTEPEADAVLRRLAQDDPGLLEPTRASARLRSPTYRLRDATLRALGSAVAYSRRSLDDTDRKILEHVAEYGRISNRTVRNLLDVDTYRARDLLRDLQRRRILMKVSAQQRGRNVEYGPGPAFPS